MSILTYGFPVFPVPAVTDAVTSSVDIVVGIGVCVGADGTGVGVSAML